MQSFKDKWSSLKSSIKPPAPGAYLLQTHSKGAGGGGKGVLHLEKTMVSVLHIACFSDVRGLSRSLSLSRGTANDLGRLRIRLFFTKNCNYKLRKLKKKNVEGHAAEDLKQIRTSSWWINNPRSVQTKFYSRDWLYNLLFTSEQ